MYINIFIILIILSAICMGIEFFIPGFGIFGISGLILFFVSSVILILKVPHGINIVATVTIILACIMVFIFRLAKKHKLNSKLILTDTLNEDKKDIAGLDYFAGKVGTTKTDLKPCGVVQFGDIEIDAISDGVYIKKNSQIKVYRIENNKLVVKRLSDFNRN